MPEHSAVAADRVHGDAVRFVQHRQHAGEFLVCGTRHNTAAVRFVQHRQHAGEGGVEVIAVVGWNGLALNMGNARSTMGMGIFPLLARSVFRTVMC